MTMHATAGYSR